MDLVMDKNQMFQNLSIDEMIEVDGGNLFWDSIKMTAGSVGIAVTPMVAVAAATGVIATGGVPLLIVCAVGGAGLLLDGLGH